MAPGEEAEAPLLCESCTVLVTTSPSPVQPSTELLEQVLRSLAENAPALRLCRTIIVCDGCKASEKNAWRRGMVTEEARGRYEEYKARLRELLGPKAEERGLPPRCELLELPLNHGFGFAVRAALAKVATPLVCVLQHDRVFVRRVDLEPAARAMLRSPAGHLGYVLVHTRSTQNYVVRQTSRLMAKGLRPPDCDIGNWAQELPNGQRLLPCLTWYDSTHLCLASYYRDFVFSEKEPRLVKKGGFIEGELGQLQLPDFAARGVEVALAHWRTWLLSDGEEEPMVGHLDGSRYEAWDSLNERFGGFGTGRVGRRWSGPAEDRGAAAEEADDAGAGEAE